MSEWQYVRTNSKGDAVFRKDTNESLEFVKNYLKEKNIEYHVNIPAFLVYIENEEGREYVYYWTTGRWSRRRMKYKVHYYSNGIDDFVTRFLNRFVEQNKIERELKNEQNDNARVG